MIPFTADVPLRSSTLWGGYRESKLIPHLYGDVTSEAIQYNAERTLFVWADHAVSNISDIESAGQPVASADWSNTLDSTGHPVAMIRLNSPLEENSTLTATGTGKMHPRTGAVIRNPATVVWDVLANIAGRDIAETELDDFRDECAALNIEVSGKVSGGSVQSIPREICASVGAVFSADMPGYCRVYPGGSSRPAVATIGDTIKISSTADLSSVSNDLTVEYAHADGKPMQTLQVESIESVARYGRRSGTHSAPWISSSRVAYDVAARLLKMRARLQWAVAVDEITGAPRVGDIVALDHVSLPVQGDYMILSRAVDFDADLTSIAFEVPVGDEPIVSLVRVSTAFSPEQYASVSGETSGSSYILTLREEDGRPMAGAAVTMDGSTTRYTDSGGRVSFPGNIATPGRHTLDIVTNDDPPQTLSSIILI